MFKRTRARLAANKTKTTYLKQSDQREQPNRFGNAQHCFDRYTTLAKEALTMGDRIVAEGYYQHAEHYLRVMRGNRQDSPLDPGKSCQETGHPYIKEIAPRQLRGPKASPF